LSAGRGVDSRLDRRLVALHALPRLAHESRALSVLVGAIEAQALGRVEASLAVGCRVARGAGDPAAASRTSSGRPDREPRGHWSHKGAPRRNIGFLDGPVPQPRLPDPFRGEGLFP
jgi:hypothetical protein